MCVINQRKATGLIVGSIKFNFVVHGVIASHGKGGGGVIETALHLKVQSAVVATLWDI